MPTSLSRISILLLSAALAACASDGGGTSGPKPPVITPSSIGISLSNSSASIVQGQSATLTVNVTRTSFNAPIELSIDGVPAGVTAVFAATSLASGATSTTLTINTTRAANPGASSITVRARGANVSEVTATLAITITSVPPNLTLNFCQASAPEWVAVQDGQGAWTKVNPDPDKSVRVAVGTRGGVAALYGNANLEIVYGTLDELAAYYGSCRAPVPDGSKTVHGSVGGMFTELADVWLGSAWTSLAADLSYTLNGVTDGPLDLIGVASTTSDSIGDAIVARRLIVRRNQDFANGATIPQLNFDDEATTTTTMRRLTIGGLSAPSSNLSVRFKTSNGTSAVLDAVRLVSGVFDYAGLPSEATQPGDLHVISVNDQALNLERASTLYLRNVDDRSMHLAAPIGEPTVGQVSGSGLRWRAQMTSPNEYDTYVMMSFYQDDPEGPRRTSILMTAAYVGTEAPSTWDIAIPDLTPAGFDPTRGLLPNIAPSWVLTARGGSTLAELLDPKDGVALVSSTRFSSESSQANRARPVLSPRTLMPVRR